MRNNYTLICGFIFLFFCSGCRLDGETLVEGQIVDQHTGQPIGNGYVVVYSDNSNGYSGSYGYLTEGKTDAGGRFGFTFEGSGDMICAVLPIKAITPTGKKGL